MACGLLATGFRALAGGSGYVLRMVGSAIAEEESGSTAAAEVPEPLAESGIEVVSLADFEAVDCEAPIADTREKNSGKLRT